MLSLRLGHLPSPVILSPQAKDLVLIFPDMIPEEESERTTRSFLRQDDGRVAGVAT
jgi:hypothetical protein